MYHGLRHHFYVISENLQNKEAIRFTNDISLHTAPKSYEDEAKDSTSVQVLDIKSSTTAGWPTLKESFIPNGDICIPIYLFGLVRSEPTVSLLTRKLL